MSRRTPFTIIELLAVIVIISILAALILGIAGYASGKGYESKTVSQLLALEDALEQFREDRGFYPATLPASPVIQLGDHFAAAAATPVGTSTVNALQDGNFVNSQTGVPYIPGYRGGPYLDAWGRPFLYRRDGNAAQNNTSSFDLWSAGRDGIIGTEDDITNWKRN